ncbi:hypothetical protein C1H76_4373 [Elsinoe australis]|uniref:Uncharacterized protein n=1 Tax=Elsinoe australis TaxID=40998 RepID=A0A4U7B3H1_9PEZI|nr:hypothetical protein C1H76_4373 [Elsinoe australis]
MPEDDAPTTTSTPTRSSPSSWADIFTLPRLLKDLFSHFPLTTYGPNPLPSRSGPHHSPRPVLYIFATPAAAHRNEPSYNPTCLKWQTYLKLSGIEFDAVASNNHASPSGSLPFVLPAHAGTAGKAGGKEGAPVPTGKIRRWVEDQCPGRQEEDKLAMRREVYFSLLDHRLRRAWLYQLYLHPQNKGLLEKLYTAPFSEAGVVRYATEVQLRKAAEEEVRKSNAVGQIGEEEVMREGEEALDALEELLGSEQWFFGVKEPGLFDAAVFAYTHLLLEEWGWGWNALGGVLKGKKGLVKHRRRVWKRAFGG